MDTSCCVNEIITRKAVHRYNHSCRILIFYELAGDNNYEGLF